MEVEIDLWPTCVCERWPKITRPKLILAMDPNQQVVTFTPWAEMGLPPLPINILDVSMGIIDIGA